MNLAERVAERSIQAVIRKEKGEYCVRSLNNPDWCGGCYPTEEKAKERLRQVEFFKHKKARDWDEMPAGWDEPQVEFAELSYLASEEAVKYIKRNMRFTRIPSSSLKQIQKDVESAIAKVLKRL